MSLLLALTGGAPPPTVQPVSRLTSAGIDQGTATLGGVIRLGIIATAIIAPCIAAPRMIAEEPLLRPRITVGLVVAVAPAAPTPAYRLTSPPPVEPDALRGRITPATYRPPSVPVRHHLATLYEPVELTGLIRSAPAPVVVVVGWITAPITLDTPRQMAGRIINAPLGGDEAEGPALTPPFAAFIDAYQATTADMATSSTASVLTVASTVVTAQTASVVNTTPHTLTVNTTPEGVTG